MSACSLIAVVTIFIAWSFIDFLLNGMLLQDTYAATTELWRPIDEMKMVLMYSVTLAATVCFVLVYVCLVNVKSLSAGIKLGLLFGLASGVSMGFRSYSYMPIPLSLAEAWFGATLVQGLVAGVLVGAIIKPQDVIS